MGETDGYSVIFPMRPPLRTDFWFAEFLGNTRVTRRFNQIKKGSWCQLRNEIVLFRYG